MSGDFINDLFTDNLYPGSKRERREPVAPAPKLQDDTAWDARPNIKVHNGENVEFFTVGALAKALGRELVTVRLWERKGYIPNATYRMPNKNGLGGRRLYTRAQIEAVLRAASDRGLLDTPRIDWTKHHPGLANEITQAWNSLR